MEVPDWGAAPDQDYPSLSAPAEVPSSLNAQKKAKRKRKQQKIHLQALLDEPIQLPLHQPRNEDIGECTTKPSFATDLQLTEASRSVITTACMPGSCLLQINPETRSREPALANMPTSLQLRFFLLNLCKRACRRFDKSSAVSHLFQLLRETVKMQPF